MPTRTPSQMLCTALMAAAATLGTAAVAQPSSIDVNGRANVGSVTRSKVVAIGDLNLANAQGQRRLDQRLRHTASYVCNDSGMWGTRPPKDYVRCYSDALTGARSLVAERLASGDMRPIRVASR
ncbi:MAG: UrcA family protein [Sphingomonas bacterium]|nr:UrcA family protein [Sphingomonas bacterium]MDB5688809.1 UrcA family protein [Sphingomonas bacterium]